MFCLNPILQANNRKKLENISVYSLILMFQVGSEYELRAGAASVLDNINRWEDIL
jgi:hypothetical protein